MHPKKANYEDTVARYARDKQASQRHSNLSTYATPIILASSLLFNKQGILLSRCALLGLCAVFDFSKYHLLARSASPNHSLI